MTAKKMRASSLAVRMCTKLCVCICACAALLYVLAPNARYAKPCDFRSVQGCASASVLALAWQYELMSTYTGVALPFGLLSQFSRPLLFAYVLAEATPPKRYFG